jgi:predicted secreted protein
MPETLTAVRYKKDPLSRILFTPLLPIVGRGQKNHPTNIPPKKKPQNPFKLFAKPDILLLLIINALICAVFYGVIASISTLFDNTYDFLDVTTIGLCFLGIGGGMAIGSSLNGKLMDMWFEREKQKFARDMAASGKQVDMNDLAKNPDFPLERVGELFEHGAYADTWI